MKNKYRIVNLMISGLIIILTPLIADSQMENSSAMGDYFTIQYTFICLSLMILSIFVFITGNKIINDMNDK